MGRGAPSAVNRSRASTSVVSGGLALLALAACERPGAVPGRVPGDGSGAALSVPYPVADAERIEGIGRQALVDARFVLIEAAPAPEPGDHTLPAHLGASGPVLVAHHVEPIGTAIPQWTELRRLAFGRVPPTPEAVPVAAAELEALDLRPPAETVWLVGPRGTCRAAVGPPLVAAYAVAGRDQEILAVGYRLEGCPAQPWAPVGIVADAIPVDFRWVPAETSTDVVLPLGRPWDDPLAAVLEDPAWDYESEPTVARAHVREIPGASPRVLQVHLTWMSARPESAPLAWCEVDAAWTRADGWYNDRWIDPVPWSPDAVGPFMLGAFLNGPQVDAVIYDDQLDGLVLVPPGPLDDLDDPAAWRQVFVPTGVYDDATRQAWGVRPARGPRPVGPLCPPFSDAPAE